MNKIKMCVHVLVVTQDDTFSRVDHVRMWPEHFQESHRLWLWSMVTKVLKQCSVAYWRLSYNDNLYAAQIQESDDTGFLI